MIGRLTGILLEKNPPQIILDCQGVGYEVSVPMSTFYNLPTVNEKITLLTHFIVREDAQLLYGFATEEERSVFRQLIKITGIGARIGLAILSGMSVKDLVRAVNMQEVGFLTKIPGIGKKTGERLLLELKGKLGSDFVAGVGAFAQESGADIQHALLALGYSDKEVALAVAQLPGGVGVSEGIKLALKLLSKP